MVKGEIAQMELVKKISSGPSSNPGKGFFFSYEKQLFAVNPGQDLNYHAEHACQIYFNYMGN